MKECATAGCEYAAVEQVNKEAVLPLLRDLVRTPFFRYFKVNLYCDCPFWPDDGMCMLRDCGVCECEPDEVPAPWKAADSAANCEGIPAGACQVFVTVQTSPRVVVKLETGLSSRLGTVLKGDTCAMCASTGCKCRRTPRKCCSGAGN